MANSRMTISAVLGMVQSTAQTITNSLNAVNDGVEMINNAVSDAAERQQIRSDNDMAMYESVYIAEKALELDQSRDHIRSYISQSEQHKSGYESALTELQQAVAQRKSKRGKK